MKPSTTTLRLWYLSGIRWHMERLARYGEEAARMADWRRAETCAWELSVLATRLVRQRQLWVQDTWGGPSHG